MHKKRILILGGGISGLSLAYFLSKRSDCFDIHLLEKNHRLGGWIDSDRSTGFFFEKGPRIFRGSTSRAFLSLVNEIGLEKEMIHSSPQAKGRYLWKNGKLRRLPMLSGGLIAGVIKELFTKPSPADDESVWDFACRRFNPTIASDVFDPMVTGIFGGSSHDISVKLAFPKLLALEKEHGSVIKGFFKTPKFKGPALFSFQRGVKSLVQKLEEVTPAMIHYGEEVVTILQKDQGFVVQTGNREYETDFLFSALPCQELGKLLIPQLLNIPLRGTTLVNVGYTQKVIHKKGFGYLVASQENEEVMGVIFDSNSFTEFNRTPEETRLTVLLKRENLSDNEARDIALRSLKKHLQITETLAVSMVVRAPGVFPQLRVGHAKKMEAIESMVREKYPNLHLVGNYFYGVGVSDCISRAQSVAENFLRATVS